MMKYLLFLTTIISILMIQNNVFAEEYFKNIDVCDASFATEICELKVKMLESKKVLEAINMVPATYEDIQSRKLSSFYSMTRNGDKIGEVGYYYNYSKIFSTIFQYNHKGQLIAKVAFETPNVIINIQTYYYNKNGQLSRIYYLDKGFYYKEFMYDGKSGKLVEQKWFALNYDEKNNPYIEKMDIKFDLNGSPEEIIKDKLSNEEAKIADMLNKQLKRMLALQDTLNKQGIRDVISSSTVRMTAKEYAKIISEFKKYDNILGKIIKENGHSMNEFQEYKDMLYSNPGLREKIEKAIKAGNFDSLNDKKSLYFEDAKIDASDSNNKSSGKEPVKAATSKMKAEDYAEIVVETLDNQELLNELLKSRGYSQEDYKAFQEELKSNTELNTFTNELITEYFSQKSPDKNKDKASVKDIKVKDKTSAKETNSNVPEKEPKSKTPDKKQKDKSDKKETKKSSRK